MDGRLARTNCGEAGDYVVPNVLSPRDLVSRPDIYGRKLYYHRRNRKADQRLFFLATNPKFQASSHFL